MKTETVRIHLNASTYLKYEKAARLNQMTLSTFLRGKLEESENTISEISALKSAIHDLRLDSVRRSDEKRAADENNQHQNAESKLDINPVLMEIVLLLRGIFRPEHMNMVHGELRRQGLDVFSTVN
ncbi:hypothetical protein ACI0FM_14565 [Paenochrobactrum sp. BZR 588]|uniref:hypothetical protein n=1 Tax=unclassified Paenochrobactrum TaxID=2639760 RepID=UPI0038520448